MNLNLITGQAVPAKSGVTLMARIRGASAALITNASMTSVSYVLTDKTTGLQADSQTLSGVIFDSLQQDGLWSKDSANAPGPDGAWGYNFRFTVPAAKIVNGGDRYRADIIMTPVTGEPFRIPFEWTALQVYG